MAVYALSVFIVAMRLKRGYGSKEVVSQRCLEGIRIGRVGSEATCTIGP